MIITPLAEHPETIPTLAAWHHDEWGHMNPARTPAQRIEGLRACARDEGIPTAFVAMEGGEPIGSALLVEEDMTSHPEQSPWLASVYVPAEHRGRGVGTALVRRAMAEAKRLEIKRLYLYTYTAESLYRRLGWRVLQREHYRGHDVAVMYLDLG